MKKLKDSVLKHINLLLVNKGINNGLVAMDDRIKVIKISGNHLPNDGYYSKNIRYDGVTKDKATWLTRAEADSISKKLHRMGYIIQIEDR